MQCGGWHGQGPLRVTWANLGSADGSIGPASKARGWGAARRRAGQVPTFLGGNRLCWCVFDGPSDPHCTPPWHPEGSNIRVHTQGWGATHSPVASIRRVCGPGAEHPAKPCLGLPWRGRLRTQTGEGLGPATCDRPHGDGLEKATVTTAREVTTDKYRVSADTTQCPTAAPREGQVHLPISQMRT